MFVSKIMTAGASKEKKDGAVMIVGFRPQLDRNSGM